MPSYILLIFPLEILKGQWLHYTYMVELWRMFRCIPFVKTFCRRIFAPKRKKNITRICYHGICSLVSNYSVKWIEIRLYVFNAYENTSSGTKWRSFFRMKMTENDSKCKNISCSIPWFNSILKTRKVTVIHQWTKINQGYIPQKWTHGGTLLIDNVAIMQINALFFGINQYLLIYPIFLIFIF